MFYSYFFLACLSNLALVLFFSGAEAAFLTLADHDIIEMTRAKGGAIGRVKRLLREASTLLPALKLIRLCFTVSFVISSTIFAVFLAQHTVFTLIWTLPIFFIFISTILIGVNELWAARFVVHHSLAFAEKVSPLLVIFYKMTRPLGYLYNRLLRYWSRRAGVPFENDPPEAILAMVEDGSHGDLEDEEREMIHSIIEFRDTQAHEIMIPRIDMVCVDEGVSLNSLIKLIREKGHSRIPLFKEDVDNILGIIYAKDLLRQKQGAGTGQMKLANLARPAYFVPETKSLHDLLRDFQRDKHHMAIVLDEYGGTAGLITLEDVIEEIVGDIQDEYDREAPLVRRIDDHNYFVDAKIDLHELNAFLNIELPTEGEYESLGGFILNLTGYVPEEKEVVTFEKYSFRVEKVKRNRILIVKLSMNGVSVPVQENKPGAQHEE